MDMKEFIDILLQVITVVLSIAVGFGLTLWRDMGRRMETVEKEKAGREEVDELRGELRALSEDVRKSSDATHAINVAIARLIEQMNRVVSDIESEKRTRGEANKALMEEIRRSEAAIISRMTQVVTYGRRKGDLPS